MKIQEQLRKLKLLKENNLKKLSMGKFICTMSLRCCHPFRLTLKVLCLLVFFNPGGRATKICGMRRIERVSILKNR